MEVTASAPRAGSVSHRNGKSLSREDVSRVLETREQRIVGHFPDGFHDLDSFGFDVTPAHVDRYLRTQHQHTVEIIREALNWMPGARVAEIGVAWGQNLLSLGKDYGLDVCGFELAENIKVYCRAVAAEGIPLYPFDVYAPGSPIPGAPYDFLIFSEVLEHLFIDVDVVLDRLVPFVRPGGRILLTTPNIYRDWNLLRMLRGYNLCEKHPQGVRQSNGATSDRRTHPREYTMFEIAHAFDAHQEWRLLKIWTCLSESRPRDLRSVINRLLLKALLRFSTNEYIFAVAERRDG